MRTRSVIVRIARVTALLVTIGSVLIGGGASLRGF